MLTTVLLPMLLFGNPPPRSACTCLLPAGSPREQATAALEQADAVFVGRVLSITDTAAADSGDLVSIVWSTRKVIVRVDSLWKGHATDSIIVWTGRGGGDCGYPFRVNAVYLIFADSRDSTSYFTTICTLTEDRPRAASIINALGAPMGHVGHDATNRP